MSRQLVICSIWNAPRSWLEFGAIEEDLDAIVDASTTVNADDEHDPEGSTIAYERAQVGALLARAQTNLGDIERALARLVAGEYSVCERCHSQISAERLAALPAGRICIECAADKGTALKTARSCLSSRDGSVRPADCSTGRRFGKTPASSGVLPQKQSPRESKPTQGWLRGASFDLWPSDSRPEKYRRGASR